MGRPLKKGLSYFPLNSEFFSNRKVQMLLVEYGNEGITVYLAILAEVYKWEGYYAEKHPGLSFDISFSLRMTQAKVLEIMAYIEQSGFFDVQQLQTHGIYTSTGIQRRYFETVKRNKSTMRIDYLTRSFREVLKLDPIVSAAETPYNRIEENRIEKNRTEENGIEEKRIPTKKVEKSVELEKKTKTKATKTTIRRATPGKAAAGKTTKAKAKKTTKTTTGTTPATPTKKPVTVNQSIPTTHETNIPAFIVCNEAAHRKARLQQMADAAADRADA